MQVLLVNPDSPFLIDPAAFPPLGLLYLGAALEANDVDVRVVDLGLERGTVTKQRAEFGCMVVRDAMAWTPGWEEMYWSKEENCLMVRRKPC